MMVRPISDYLSDFGLCSRENPTPSPCFTTADSEDEIDASAEAQEAVIQAARAEAFAEGRASAHAEFVALIQQEKRQSELRLAAARERWIEQESDKLATDLRNAICALEMNITKTFARIISPFILESLSRQMVDVLGDSIGVLLGGKEQPIIKVRGPQDLLARLHEKERTRAMEYIPSESVDVQITCCDTVIETQVATWADRIEALWREGDG